MSNVTATQILSAVNENPEFALACCMKASPSVLLKVARIGRGHPSTRDIAQVADALLCVHDITRHLVRRPLPRVA